MFNTYTGVRVIQAGPEVIDSIYTHKRIYTNAIDGFWRDDLSQNEYCVLKFENPPSNQSALTRVVGNEFVLLANDLCASGIKPRNKEQTMALDALLDDSIRVVVLTGRAGTGKTLLSLAAALKQIDSKKYKRFILSKPMSQLGKRPLGILPGEIDERFGPYLDNYMDNIEHLLNGKWKSVHNLMAQYRMDFKPLQLIQGSSWSNSFVIVDEAQVLDYGEMVMLGTRIGEGSKVVILGDLRQRVEEIEAEDTGIHKFVNAPLAKKCSFVASIDLVKCERSMVAELFANIFER